MKRLSEVMATAIVCPDVMEAAKAQRVMRDWTSAVGELLASKTTPDRFDRGTVWVAATGSAWAQELRMRREEVIMRLNDLAGDEVFKDIRVGVRAPRVWDAPPVVDLGNR